MHQKKQITLAIVTKNRPDKLSRLLHSIVLQTLRPFEVLVIDNDLNFSAKRVVKRFTGCLPIRYISERKQGVPFARNTALANIRTPYLAFTDDDCVLKYDWVFFAELFINRFPNISYFIGNSYLLNKQNRVAVAQYVHQRYWFIQKLLNGVLTTPYNVDTKNIIFKVSDLKTNKLQFDTEISIGWFDGSDTDMGFAMHTRGLKGVFLRRLQVWHEEPTNLRYFLKKGYYRGKLARILSEKWNISGEFVYLPFLNWKIYLKSIKGWSAEYKLYFSIFRKKSIISFICLKLYERMFLYGYTNRKS